MTHNDALLVLIAELRMQIEERDIELNQLRAELLAQAEQETS